jgi:hypothetical protein
MRHLDAQLRDTRKKLAAAVRASGTTLTEVFGVGPVIAGTIIGDIADVSRFPGRDHFAACNGTAPVEVSSGNRKTHRLSLRGNRRINHAIHMAAITQIRHKHSDGRAYYDKKIAEGKTHKEALRSLKRRISDAIFARLLADARRAGQRPAANGPGGQPGNGSDSSAAGSHPERRLFGQATPGPGHHDTARHQGRHTLTVQADFKENPDNHLTAATKRTRSGVRRTPPTVVCWAGRTGHSVPAVGMFPLRGSACSLVGTSAVTRCRRHDALALSVSRRFRSSSILARSDQISVLSGCSTPRSRVQDPAA